MLSFHLRLKRNTSINSADHCQKGKWRECVGRKKVGREKQSACPRVKQRWEENGRHSDGDNKGTLMKDGVHFIIYTQ